MSQQLRGAAVLATLLAVSACADRSTPLEPGGSSPGQVTATTAPQITSPEQGRHERLARAFALALRDGQFRNTVFKALQESRYREGKLHLQAFLGAEQGKQRRKIAELAEVVESEVGADLDQAAPIEIYLPVPAHRRNWQGDANLLVATAEADHDAPVAFDIKGNRRLLDPDVPPSVPVIALVRAELSFGSGLAGAACADCWADDGTPPVDSTDQPVIYTGNGTSPTSGAGPGLYLTHVKLDSEFEGWLKGAPEIEVHILGQDGSTSAMKSYQCAGESAGTPYNFNMDSKEWSGSVMLFSQAQLDAYKAAHPGQAVRIFLLEDDDGPCQIKMDSSTVARMFAQIAAAFGFLTGGKDTLISVKTFKKAQTLIDILKSFWSVIQTPDDIVGTAIEDPASGAWFSGANWLVRGENTTAHGAIRLEMR
jgi:hypothetical protein